MKKLKKLIARIFNLGVEDLPPSQLKEQSKTIDPFLQPFIQKQISVQIQEAIQDQVIPQLRRILNDDFFPQLKQTIIEEIEHGDFQVSGEHDLNADDLMISQSDIQDEDSAIIHEEEPKSGVDNGYDGVDTDKKALDKQEPKYRQSIVDQEIKGKEEVLPETSKIQSKSESEKVQIRVGVDFGTTTTSVSFKIGDNLPVAALFGQERQPFMPSIVYIKPGESDFHSRAIVGEEAENMGSPNEIIRSVKRCLGCIGDDCSEAGRTPFPWCEGNGYVNIGNEEVVKTGDIVYLIIREALSRAIQFARSTWNIEFGSEFVSVYPMNLGCSVKFDLEQRQILNQVIHDLGFQNFQFSNIIEEPILAGFTYSRFEENPTGRTLIYDFGGGTFDTAVVDIDQTEDGLRVTVVSSDGDNWLGGDDFDRSIFGFILESIATSQNQSEESIVNQLSSEERSSLLRLSRQAKEQLSSYPEFSDVLPTETFGFLSLDISRDELENLIKNSKFIDRSLDATLRACKLAYAFDVASESDLVDYSKVIRYKLEDASDMIDHVLLVGGITKIPVIRKELSRIFGEEKLVEEQVIEPISAVAIGAAYPRKPQHFSITVPSFGFLLKYQRSDKQIQDPIEILPAYEYLNFHKHYALNSCPMFVREFQVPVEYSNGSLFYKSADDKKWHFFTDIGQMRAGLWRFQIDIEGNVSLKFRNQTSQIQNEFPVVHPLQKKIRSARLNRIQKRQQEERDRTSGKTITIFTEK